MLHIGLTGQTGAGKGAFCRYLQETRGIPSIDADAVYHSLLVPPSECLDALAAEYGAEILLPSGSLDRKFLAAKVFGDPDPARRAERIRRLNGITHPRVLKRMREIAKEYEIGGAPAVVFDVPALYESGFDAECDLVVAVTASRETRVCRIMDRDALTRTEAERRVNAQHEEEFYTERASAVLPNDGTLAEFGAAAEDFCRRYLDPAQTKRNGGTAE